jgi:hypothetical protein
MPTVLIGIAALVAMLWLLQRFAKADPQTLIRNLRTTGGIGALASAVALGATGRIGVALPLGVAGLALLGLLPGAASFGLRTRKSARQVSRVRSAFLEMELDHDSGTLSGRILAGRHEGVSLDALDAATLVGLLAEIDEESRALLATYLDRRQPGWREHAQADTAAGQGGAAAGRANVEGGGVSDPWPSARGQCRGHRTRASRADEETASRSGGVDVPCGPRQRGQGRSSSTSSLKHSIRNTTSNGSCSTRSLSRCQCAFRRSDTGSPLRICTSS